MIEMLVILVLLLIILLLAVLVKLEFKWIERKIYRGDQQKMIKRGTVQSEIPRQRQPCDAAPHH
jgi:hypothetical protein